MVCSPSTGLNSLLFIGSNRVLMRLRKKLQHICILTAWLFATGAQWDIAQTFAWAKMFSSYSESTRLRGRAHGEFIHIGSTDKDRTFLFQFLDSLRDRLASGLVGDDRENRRRRNRFSSGGG